MALQPLVKPAAAGSAPGGKSGSRAAPMPGARTRAVRQAVPEPTGPNGPVIFLQML